MVNPFDPQFKLQMDTISSAVRATEELKCTKGIKCGNSCQSRKRSCDNAVSGTTNRLVNKLANVVRVATNKPVVSLEFDGVGDRVLSESDIGSTVNENTKNIRLSVKSDPNYRRAVFVTPDDVGFIKKYDTNQEFSNKFNSKFQYNSDTDRYRVSSNNESFILDRRDLESVLSR